MDLKQVIKALRPGDTVIVENNDGKVTATASQAKVKVKTERIIVVQSAKTANPIASKMTKITRPADEATNGNDRDII